jgi:hypothetical protein
MSLRQFQTHSYTEIDQRLQMLTPIQASQPVRPSRVECTPFLPPASRTRLFVPHPPQVCRTDSALQVEKKRFDPDDKEGYECRNDT